MSLSVYPLFLSFFFFNDTATTEIYTLSLHDALPIWEPGLDLPAAADPGPPHRLPDGGPEHRVGCGGELPADPGGGHPGDGDRLRRQGRQWLRHPDLGPGRHQHAWRGPDPTLHPDLADAAAAADPAPEWVIRLRRRRLQLPVRWRVMRGKKN